MEENRRLSKRLRRKRLGKRVSNVYAAIIYAFIYVPIAVMVIFSFNDQLNNYYWVGFTTKWYVKLFSGSELWGYLWNSLVVAVLATIISVIIGTLGAMGLMRFEFMLKKVINSSLYIPVIIPEIVMGISLLMLYQICNFPLGLPAVTLAHITFCAPFVVIIMRGRMSGMDLSVEEASMDLGANRLETFFRITVPMLVPGLLSSAFMAFTLSIDDVIITNFVAGPYSTTLPVKILSMVKMGLHPDVNALTTIMIAVLILGILVNNLVQAALRKRSLGTVKTYF